MLHRTINIPKNNNFFLFGARGTGKSTLLKAHFATLPREKVLYIDLLRFSERNALDADPDSLESRILSTTEWVVIDEVQKVPQVLDTVHRLIEERRALFALTGSSARKLKAGGANLLAGRALVYELFPLTHRELDNQFNLLETLRWGSLPGMYQQTKDEERALFLDAYAETYLKEEIWDEHLVRNLGPFRRFLQVAAQASGTVINYSQIASDVQVDTKTVQGYFQILEDTLLGYMLEPYHSSPRKRLRQNPKFYLFDIGVTRALTRDYSLEIDYSSLGFGYRFEHFLIVEMHRLNANTRARFQFSFIRTKDKKEVDLVVERPGLPLALVEIKSTRSVSEAHLEGLAHFLPHFPQADFFCLSLDQHEKSFGKIRALHWEQGLQELGL